MYVERLLSIINTKIVEVNAVDVVYVDANMYSRPTLFLSYRSQHYLLHVYPSSINILYMCSIMMITISGLKIMQVKSLEYKLKVSLRTLSNHYIRLGRPARKGKSKLSL